MRRQLVAIRIPPVRDRLVHRPPQHAEAFWRHQADWATRHLRAQAPAPGSGPLADDSTVWLQDVPLVVRLEPGGAWHLAPELDQGLVRVTLPASAPPLDAARFRIGSWTGPRDANALWRGGRPRGPLSHHSRRQLSWRTAPSRAKPHPENESARAADPGRRIPAPPAAGGARTDSHQLSGVGPTPPLERTLPDAHPRADLCRWRPARWARGPRAEPFTHGYIARAATPS